MEDTYDIYLDANGRNESFLLEQLVTEEKLGERLAYWQAQYPDEDVYYE